MVHVNNREGQKMQLGTLVRYHGGLKSTAPVGIIVRYKHDKQGHWRKDRALVYWAGENQQWWESVYRLERVV